jgi:hypothetical protein
MSVTIMASFRQAMFWERCFAKGFGWKTNHLHSYTSDSEKWQFVVKLDLYMFVKVFLVAGCVGRLHE